MCFLRCLLSFMKHKICSFPGRYFIFLLLKEVVTKKTFFKDLEYLFFLWRVCTIFVGYNTIWYIVQLLYDIDFTISWAQQGFQQCRQKFCNFATLLWKFPNFTTFSSKSYFANCGLWRVNSNSGMLLEMLNLLSANPIKWLDTLTLTLCMARWLAIMIW